MPDQDVAQGQDVNGQDASTATVAASASGGHDHGPSTAERVDDEPRAGLQRRLEALRGVFATAIAAMERAIAEMRFSGLPPDYRLLTQLGDCHREFLRLRLDVVRHAGELGFPVPSTDHLRDLAELGSQIGALHSSTKPTVAPRPESPPIESTGQAASPKEAVQPIAIEPHPPEEVTSASVEPEPAASESVATPHVEALGEPIEPGPTAAAPPFDAPAEPAPSVAEEPYRVEAAGETLPASNVPAGEALHAEPSEKEAAPERVQVRDAALRAIDKILRLSVRDGGEVPALASCRDQAVVLRQSVEVCGGDPLPPEAVSLASGQHPFASLLVMVEGNTSLTDAQWAELHSSVSAAYGRQLAIAAARGRLVFRS
jgi:hypothetical protein